MKIKLPNNAYKVKLTVLNRIEVKDYFITEPYYVVEYDEKDTITSDQDKEVTLVKMVVEEVAKFGQTILMPNNQVLEKIQKGIETLLSRTNSLSRV